MKLGRITALVLPIACMGILALLPARISLGCAFQDIATVHFNTFNLDFGTPVRRTPRGFWDSELWDTEYEEDTPNPSSRYTERRFAANSSARLADSYTEYDAAEELKLKIAFLYDDLEKQVQAGNWSRARLTCLNILHKTGKWTGDLRDRVDLLDAITNRRRFTSSELKAVKRYFSAVEQARKWPVASDVLNRISNSPGGAFLKDRVAYKYACIAYESNNPAEALKLFSQFAISFPSSPKREDALIMIARICILKDAPDPKTVETGLMAIAELLSSYPHTRFYGSAFGLRARVHFLRLQYSDAIWCYYRLGDLESVKIVCDAMPHETSSPAIVRLLEAYLRWVTDESGGDMERDVLSVRQVNHLRNRLSLDMLRIFQEDLKNSPRLLISYVYYRLYYTNTREQDLANLAALARGILSRSPGIRINPAVEIRLAEVEYQQRHYPQCIEWASRALKINPRLSRALFIRASAEEKTHDFTSAHADLTRTLAVSKDNTLRIGARQLLALVCEREGDFSEALNQYYALGYNLDAAYLLDVRMGPKQIESYLRHSKDVRITDTIDYYMTRPSKPLKITYMRSQLLAYTIGIHLLRQEKWGEASRWLSRLPKRLRYAFDMGRRVLGSGPSPDAMTAVSDLSRLQAAAHYARGYEARAAAAYRYASYYHTHGDLLLYNAMLWDGSRVYSFEEGWSAQSQTPADVGALRTYFASHEVNLRSRELCLAVAKRYPRSRVAPQAFYRAACASEYAGALAYWFERQNKSFRFTPKSEGSQLMFRMATLYPRSPLAATARKYAQVFAAETRMEQWPHYAVLGRGQHRASGDQPGYGAAAAAEMLLATNE